MNLKFEEWNDACKYASEVCESISKEYNANVKSRAYTMYDGRKGIYLQIFDDYGKFFNQYATGIHNSLPEMKEAIDTMSKRIITEVIQTE